MNKYIGMATTCMALTLVCGAASAQDLGKLGGMIPGAGSGLSSGSMSNVAGLLQYCVKNNYLGGASGAAGVQDQLMSKLGGSTGGGSSAGSGSSTSDMLGQLTGNKAKSAESTSTGTDPTSDPGYLNGAKGLLQGSNGKTTDLSSLGGGSSDLQSQLTRKVCDTVLKQGKSFIGM